MFIEVILHVGRTVWRCTIQLDKNAVSMQSNNSVISQRDILLCHGSRFSLLMKTEGTDLTYLTGISHCTTWFVMASPLGNPHPHINRPKSVEGKD
ncbi:hypothetical protein TNCV_558001 [Trichonephila clavipes]|nr:hypothetical protein TNCV_558001 [Trichonephila clavipes]